MNKLKIEGITDLNKVAMTKAIQKHTILGLKEAKNITDELLLNGCVTVEVKNKEISALLINSLKKANAKVTLLSKHDN